MWDTNVYYSPEKFGLKVVAEIDYSSGDYQFDRRVVWSDKDGFLYTARDAGCSCPTPFEDYTSLATLERADIRDLEAEAQSEYREYRTLAEKTAFLEKVRKGLRRECPACRKMAVIPDDDYLCGVCRK